MKKTLFLVSIALISIFGSGYRAQAQVSVHFNLGVQPLWGPTGYDYAQYYYIPDIDAYYDVNNQTYVYLDNGSWVTTSYLPPRYSNFDLYRAHKVVINTPSPWMHHDRYRNSYWRYRGHNDQVVIRDSREQRYWANPQHPNHGRWNGNNMRHEEHRDWGGNRPGNNGWGHENRGRDNHGHDDNEHGDHGHGRGHR